MVSAANGDGLADRVKLLGLEIDEQAIILDALDDPPDGLAPAARRPDQRAPVAPARRARRVSAAADEERLGELVR